MALRRKNPVHRAVVIFHRQVRNELFGKADAKSGCAEGGMRKQSVVVALAASHAVAVGSECNTGDKKQIDFADGDDVFVAVQRFQKVPSRGFQQCLAVGHADEEEIVTVDPWIADGALAEDRPKKVDVRLGVHGREKADGAGIAPFRRMGYRPTNCGGFFSYCIRPQGLEPDANRFA